MSSDIAINFHDADEVCGLFEAAAHANRCSPGRSGCVVDLGDRGRLVITGDLHDHTDNYERILRLARLDEAPDNHLVLQEIIHGERLVSGHDLSYRALARVAQLKLLHGGRVHQLLSNHELAQAAGERLMKDGQIVVEAFTDGLAYVFGDAWQAVSIAIRRYIRSLPLAVRCANGVLCAHSLPAPHVMAGFDPAVLDRELTGPDMAGPRGDAYLMVWGRGLTQDAADVLGEAWHVNVFVLGHQYVATGWQAVGRNILILNSDHAHGMALPIELSQRYTRDELCNLLVPLAGVQ